MATSLEGSAKWVVLVVILLQACLAACDYEMPSEALPTRSGYLDVNTATATSLFYAYYEALEPSDELLKTPVILWLQGGPGCSGLIGNFGELGPWRVAEDMKLEKNTAPWNRRFGLLFIDSPAGSGFSIAPSPDSIVTNQYHVARDLFRALELFFSDPDYKSRPLYITGESYGGKYVPALGYYVMAKSRRLLFKTEQPPYELRGIAIGNGLTHPIVQVQTYGATAYYMGLIDKEQQKVLDGLAKESKERILKKDWLGAVAARSNLTRILRAMSGLATLEDVRKSVDYFTDANGTDYLTAFVNLETVKKALGAHTNITWTQCSDLVDEKMQVDIMKSTKWMLEALLPQLPVLLYQGQWDIQDGVASSEAWMRTIAWRSSAAFWASERKLWKEEGKLAGYIRTLENLSHVVVAGAGHLAPSDQNLRTQRMIEAWIDGKLELL
ncbi:serine carboxypeptidase-like 50 [Physcomitrium patens]|uniref:Carboxypeptidase n=1 Tax=Physcomitrium patens TaxID=3218 RepID=A9TM23_PHYPA|nr:serine carboxypeptidase-like 50 [Physcomitrium patens]PNR44912.1 hypothetical protein PHYPA_014682 [Physcomitrium patens]|eukprot:XP_024389236.1 serine carboxypeptidase-like 50 [Physcomitrella patens]